MTSSVREPPRKSPQNPKTATKPLFALHCFTPNRGSKIAGFLRDVKRAILLFSMVCHVLTLPEFTENSPISDAKKV